jgi:ectoine hydroxylase-related dioxygenase (phytanoyl-CoA dioxygenase family)
MNQQINLQNDGYIVYHRQLSHLELEILDIEYKQFFDKGKLLLKNVYEMDSSLEKYYKENIDELIVVPEVSSPLSICRIEYLSGYSKTFKDNITNMVQDVISGIMKEPFLLFKDKCNLKLLGGGEFDPHQDIAAYMYFKINYFVTAAIALDDSTIQNGCLEVAYDYQKVMQNFTTIKTKFGSFPIFDFYQCGQNNGDIINEVADKFRWQKIEMKRGDIVFFDSFVPHKSEKNNSPNQRRIFFLTFNPACYGDIYQKYYETKKNDFNNPVFHISTPTG